MDEWFAIANPAAGVSACRKLLPDITGLLIKYGIKFKKILSEKKEHAVKLAYDASREGYRKFISIGGDGTANEIVNGIKKYAQKSMPDFVLGVIPAGTGNDWGRSFGLTGDHENAVRAIKNGSTKVQDICRATYMSREGIISEKYFINVAGAGYDADVLFRTEKMKAGGRKGSWLYFYNIFASLFSYVPAVTTVRIDGDDVIKEKALSINAGIGKYNGGGLMQVPHAVLDDGNIAVTFIGDIGKIGILTNLHRLKNGNIKNIRKVQLLKGRKIEIFSETTMLFEADGEALGETPLTFEVVPEALRVISEQA